MIRFLVLLILTTGLAHADDLRMMTWNVYMLPYPIKASQQGPRRKLIVEKIKESDRDIIFFQEAFTGTFQRHLKKKLKDIYPYQYTLGRKHFLFIGMGSGLTVISRYPFVVLDKVYYKDCEGPDCYASKGSFLIEVTLPSGKKVQVANTHLQAGGDQRKTEIRWKQLDLVRELFDRFRVSGVPQLLAGDLNIDSSKGDDFPVVLSTLDIQDIPESAREGMVNPNDDFALLNREEGIHSAEVFFSGGFSIPCYKNMTDHFKLIDHFLFRPNDSGIMFSQDRIVPYKGQIKGQNCYLSDHHPRELTISVN